MGLFNSLSRKLADKTVVNEVHLGKNVSNLDAKTANRISNIANLGNNIKEFFKDLKDRVKGWIKSKMTKLLEPEPIKDPYQPMESKLTLYGDKFEELLNKQYDSNLELTEQLINIKDKDAIVNIKGVEYDNSLNILIDLLKNRLYLTECLNVFEANNINFRSNDISEKYEVAKGLVQEVNKLGKSYKEQDRKFSRIAARQLNELEPAGYEESEIDYEDETYNEVDNSASQTSSIDKSGADMSMAIIGKYFENQKWFTEGKSGIGRLLKNKKFLGMIMKKFGKKAAKRVLGAIPVVGTALNLLVTAIDSGISAAKGDGNEALASLVGGLIAEIPFGVGLALSIPAEMILLEFLDYFSPNKFSEERIKNEHFILAQILKVPKAVEMNKKLGAKGRVTDNELKEIESDNSGGEPNISLAKSLSNEMTFDKLISNSTSRLTSTLVNPVFNIKESDYVTNELVNTDQEVIVKETSKDRFDLITNHTTKVENHLPNTITINNIYYE